jgi:cation diffusion facilitator family transporter
VGFLVALVAIIMAQKQANSKFTFGFARADILGALTSLLILWTVTIYLTIEAIYRIITWCNGNGKPVDGKIMFIVACGGVLVNLCLAGLFSQEHGGTLSLHDCSGHDHGHDHSSHTEEVHDCAGHDHGHDHSSHTSKLLHGDGHSSHTSKLPVKDVHDCAGQDHGHDHSSHTSKPPVKEAHDCTGHDHGHDHSSHTSKPPVKEAHDCAGEDHGHDHGHSHSSHKIVPVKEKNDHDGGIINEMELGTLGGAFNVVEHQSVSSDESYKNGIDLNMYTAYFHVMTDLAQSVVVAFAGLIIWFKPHLQIVDPICTLIFSLMVMRYFLFLLCNDFFYLFFDLEQARV